jgi:hypothetical protein
MKVVGTGNDGFIDENINTEVNLMEIIVGGDDESEDDGKDDIFMKVHTDKSDLL